MNITELMLNQKSVFIRQTNEQKDANLAIVKYIMHLAETSQQNISLWDIDTLFKDPQNKKQSLELIKVKKDINAIFFKEAEKHKAEPNLMFDQLENSIKTSMENSYRTEREERKKTLNRQINNEQNNLNYALNNVNNYLRNIVTKKRELLKLDNVNYTDKVMADLKEVLKGNFYDVLSFENNVITFVTKNDVINSLIKPSAGLNLKVNLGKFKIKLNLTNMDMKIYTHMNNTISDGIYHPYVSNSGSICWGNVSDEAASKLASLDIKGSLILLAALLVTYSDETTPYRSLHSFKAEQEKVAQTNENNRVISEDSHLPF